MEYDLHKMYVSDQIYPLEEVYDKELEMYVLDEIYDLDEIYVLH